METNGFQTALMWAARFGMRISESYTIGNKPARWGDSIDRVAGSKSMKMSKAIHWVSQKRCCLYHFSGVTNVSIIHCAHGALQKLKSTSFEFQTASRSKIFISWHVDNSPIVALRDSHCQRKWATVGMTRVTVMMKKCGRTFAYFHSSSLLINNSLLLVRIAKRSTFYNFAMVTSLSVFILSVGRDFCWSPAMASDSK